MNLQQSQFGVKICVSSYLDYFAEEDKPILGTMLAIASANGAVEINQLVPEALTR